MTLRKLELLQRTVHCLTTVIVIVVLIAQLGCEGDESPERMRLYPVQGSLHVDGQPATGAIVTLHRDPPFSDGRMPIGVVDRAGQFQIGYYDEQDGAPEGTYQMLVYWPSHDGPLAPDRLQQRYATPDHSAASVVVQQGTNSPLAIRIAGPPKS